jgi:threonine/homoserine/homoserine lactone efflux protein
MTLAGFIAYSGALALAAAIPGPGITALVARALGSGFRSSLFMSLGLILGDLVYLTAVVLGLAIVAQTFGMVFLVVKWLGVAYLGYLAWTFWTRGVTAETVEARKGRDGFVPSLLAGLTLTLGNPKTMIFYLAVTPTIVGRIRHARRTYRRRPACRAGALSGARRQGALVPANAARAEGAQPHRRDLHGRRGGGDRRPPVVFAPNHSADAPISGTRFLRTGVFANLPTRILPSGALC